MRTSALEPWSHCINLANAVASQLYTVWIPISPEDLNKKGKRGFCEGSQQQGIQCLYHTCLRTCGSLDSLVYSCTFHFLYEPYLSHRSSNIHQYFRNCWAAVRPSLPVLLILDPSSPSLAARACSKSNLPTALFESSEKDTSAFQGQGRS